MQEADEQTAKQTDREHELYARSDLEAAQKPNGSKVIRQERNRERESSSASIIKTFLTLKQQIPLQF